MMDAKKLFPNSFDGRVEELQNLIHNVSNSFDSLAKKEGTFNKLNAEVASLAARIEELDEAVKNKS